MKEYTGFRADRLKEVMEKHEATFEDIVRCTEEVVGRILTREEKHHLIDIIDGYSGVSNTGLFAICEACNCTADYLLGLSDEI